MPSLFSLWGIENPDLFPDRGTENIDLFADRRIIAEADLEKVGPKGYIHGWIYVGPQPVGARIFHPRHGSGTVSRHEDGKTHVRYDSGKEKHYEAGTRRPNARGEHFQRRARGQTYASMHPEEAAATPAAPRRATLSGPARTPSQHLEALRQMNSRKEVHDYVDGMRRKELAEIYAEAGYPYRRSDTAAQLRSGLAVIHGIKTGPEPVRPTIEHRELSPEELDSKLRAARERAERAANAPNPEQQAQAADLRAEQDARVSAATRARVQADIAETARQQAIAERAPKPAGEPRDIARDIVNADNTVNANQIAAGLRGRQLNDVADALGVRTGGSAKDRRQAIVEHAIGGALYSAPRNEPDRSAFLADHRARRMRELGVSPQDNEHDQASMPQVDEPTAATLNPEEVDVDEPVRLDGGGPLAQVPAEGVRADDSGRPGDVLPEAGAGNRAAGRRPRGRTGAADTGRSAVPGSADQDAGGLAGRETRRAGGDAADSGGQRDRAVAEAPVFRPTGQADLAPATERQRLAANLVALRTLRQIQRENRPATPDEQAKLARWSSWGSLPNVFKEPPPDRKYAEAQAELQDLLSPSEYSAARRTVRNAHYTDAAYAGAVWDAMGKLGFNGGQVLEPGSGSGTFMGLAPERTHVTGVELDPITAAISHALYPNHDVRSESFADTSVKDGSFDAVVGNVPFANTKLLDPEYNPGRSENMHNHFIIKSLRMTRPGGMVALLTSRYTMDSVRPEARKKMAELGDLVGAVRLPSGAHSKAAGTEVVTDLLLFRRREPGAPYAGLPFEHTRNVEVDGKEIPINEMFADHPDMVLGKLGATNGMHGKDDLTVTGDKDAGPALRAALDRIVADAHARGLTQTTGASATPTFAQTGAATKPDGFLQANPDGSFSRMVRGTPQPYQVPATQQDELRQLLSVRDNALALVSAEAASADDTDEMKRLREDLNRDYDAYVAKYGPVSRFTETRSGGGEGDDVEEEKVVRKRPPQGGFRADPFSSVVRSLENYDPVTGNATKADIFHKRSISPRTPRLSAENPADALALSLDQVGEVDLPHIADLLGVDEPEARETLGTLVFDEPGSSRLVPAAEYLSGNVREKLAAARLDAAADPERYGPNVEALQKVLPADLTPAEIRVRMGAPWIEPRYVQQFLQETLRDPTLRVRRKHGNDWEVKSDHKNSKAATAEWGTTKRSAVDLAEDLLSQRPVKVMVDGKLDPVKTEAAAAKARELGERFEQWAWENPARAKELLDTYNTKFNSLVLRSYPGDDMELPGLARDGFYPYPHRFAAIRRIVNEPSVGLWHEVGAGKTSVMIASAMELRRLGMAQKPAIVVPNHMLEQMTREFLERYPQAKVLSIGSDDLKGDKLGDKRRDIIARAATGDWDAVILTQGAFTRIPVSSDTEKEYLQAEVEPLRRSVARQIAEVEQRVRAENPHLSDAEVKAEVEKVVGKDPTVKEMEGMVQSAEERVKEHMAGVARDPGLSFEQTGIDYLFMDEAHTYKNLRTSSRVQGMGIKGSQIATDLHMKLHYLRGKSDRVATLATATPIANSVGEAYTMMRYLRPDLLHDMGVETFDEFASNFGEVVTRMEVSPTGGLRPHSRFSRFVNVPELLKPWLVASDVKTADDLKGIVKVPELAERLDDEGRLVRTPETVVVPPSEELKDFVGELVGRAKSIPYPPKQGDDNMLKITGEGRAAALDLRMVGRDTDEPGKLDLAADRIASIYGEHKDKVYTGRDGNPAGEPGALQLVFSDIGTPSAKTKPKKGKTAVEGEESLEDEASSSLAKFNAYEALRDKLVERGIPREKIRFIHDAKTDVDKAELFAAARDGRISVLIGSTQKMGVGTNVQDRAIALHHLDAPWRPADVQQREGRIVRQGNKNPNVHVIRYVTEQSFDSYIWQAIATKAEFINQIMKGRHDVREMTDVGDFALSAAEVTALGTGSRHLIEHTDARTDLTRLERALRNHEADQRNLGRQISEAENEVVGSDRTVQEIDNALRQRVPVTGDAFRMDVNGRSYAERSEAQEQLRATLKRVARGEQAGGVIGHLGGFPVRATGTDQGVHVELVGAPGAQAVLGRSEIGSGDVIAKLTTGLSNLERNRARLAARAEQARQDVEALRSRVGRPFRDAEALQAARDRFERADAKLKAELAQSGQALMPDNPAEQAAAHAAAQLAEVRGRLDSGGGFSGIGEVGNWAEADPDLVDKIPDGGVGKWGYLSAGGQLVAHKARDGWQITIPRSMQSSQPLTGFRTKADALEFAAILEQSGVPWNTGVDLKEWRAPDGAGIAEVVARLRGQDRRFDPKGTWKEAAVRTGLKRRTPERLRLPLLEGQYRSDGLGISALAQVDPDEREAILGILKDADPATDLATVARLRQYGLGADRQYAAQRFSLAAADRMERDYREHTPGPLDGVRKQFRREFDELSGSYGAKPRELAQIKQILAEAEATGNLLAAAAALRTLAAEIGANLQRWDNRKAVDIAVQLAEVLEHQAAAAGEQPLLKRNSSMSAYLGQAQAAIASGDPARALYLLKAAEKAAPGKHTRAPIKALRAQLQAKLAA